MSDRLEDFIRNHRSELDIDEPSVNVWNEIEGHIPSSKRRMLWSGLSVAASVLVLIVAAYFLGISKGQQTISQDMFASETEFKEFQEASDYYMTTIDHKMDQVQQLGIDEDVANDLKQLDEVYEELKEEMLTSEYENKEILINLMINNYKTKIDILERIISKKNSNESKITIDETISI
ncbi:hypothetical protein [Portibacter marinus]|uniref:hypothetical protein n=1 Tax=Portibacter marinus TaxID=2898660 RepID=UPI001F2FAD8A|nr:hypothetical protein [Portibacter marinus]